MTRSEYTTFVELKDITFLASDTQVASCCIACHRVSHVLHACDLQHVGTPCHVDPHCRSSRVALSLLCTLHRCKTAAGRRWILHWL
jgi:hypothetical protein